MSAHLNRKREVNRCCPCHVPSESIRTMIIHRTDPWIQTVCRSAEITHQQTLECNPKCPAWVAHTRAHPGDVIRDSRKIVFADCVYWNPRDKNGSFYIGNHSWIYWSNFWVIFFKSGVRLSKNEHQTNNRSCSFENRLQIIVCVSCISGPSTFCVYFFFFTPQ